MPAVMPGGVQSIQPTAHMVQILWHDPEPVYFTQQTLFHFKNFKTATVLMLNLNGDILVSFPKTGQGTT